MAILQVDATPSDGLQHYKLAIDGLVVAMKSDNEGAVAVHGDCGDKSRHVFTYTLVGPAGETLSASVKCGDATVLTVSNIQIYPEGEPYAAGSEGFVL